MITSIDDTWWRIFSMFMVAANFCFCVFLLVVLSPVLALSHDRQCTREARQPSAYVGASYSSSLDMSYILLLLHLLHFAKVSV